ncbi:hypothetical protein [Methyloversatilis sp.]|uniref:hypothetical protein n=1 Tax=Methyloversatilis sp. TaxID=2569862 RepID=UPI00273526CF|nr:hypothetical protein [Methyloversatilis sp.]MDP2868697.1 hypothetical protein [Methyloversatilis sp.]MDP3288464.1 hypothetical protein [Methyloversatilis sp.]MDP3456440.1 hypothetical protein [Methyloversatilis sp.]MDP3576714.1 hypothetical protein [Methyloversatilis sp.]
MKPDLTRLLFACTCVFLPAVGTAQSAHVRPVDLVQAVPLLTESGRAGYSRFLRIGIRPRAFALNMNGDWAWNAGEGAVTDALARCEAHGLPCQLYAVDEEVVMPGFELGAPLRALGGTLVQGDPQ